MAGKSLATLFAVAALVLVAPIGAGAQVFSPEELSELPRIDSPQQALKAVESAYPSTLKNQGIGGRVRLTFVVLPDGKVDPGSVKVVEAERDEFGAAAAAAIREIRFKPGKKDGSPVAAQVVFPITFTAG